MSDAPQNETNDLLDAEAYLGRGIYTIAEAARYADAKSPTLYSWFHNTDGALLDSDFANVGNRRRISFLDLIDAIVVARMRKHRISMPHIREVRDVLAEEWGTEHPFCRRDFRVDKSERRIIQIVEDANGSKALIDALRKDSQMEPIIGEWLRNVAYDQESQLAERWEPSVDVSLEPDVINGKPKIKGTRIPTSVVANQYYAYDEDEAPVAELFEISENEVIHAVEFEQKHGFVKKAA